ncbi:chemotaxis-specific protein-glutamate methyltransferase CheB [Azospirillum halopraeferens]|uniref:chemotaxis-specific protein-glutamate methyltransferase CheB n=1 Tax=Azospirillum halopraeferens TaxID=34010 RepID=UPI0004041D47|nr:chemotaxis-specific protein-glutamate methyltransferase CheB [Azospirillum halopraeferens]
MSDPRKVRVLVVEDSPVVQELLVHLIGRDPRLEVAAVASSAEVALRLLDKIRPDVVSLDIRLPGMNGFEATKRIMNQHPLPIVVVANDVHDASMNISMNALRAGALAVVEKPGSISRADYDAVARHLCTQLYAMSQVRVIRQRIRAADRPLAAAPPPPVPEAIERSYEVLGLVASTGGPNALVKVLNGLPTAFPLPILVVQHIGAAFAAGFATWLDTVCPQSVRLAESGMEVAPGRIYVAAGDRHLLVDRGRLRLSDDAPVCGQRPSGDVLFASLADRYGAGAIGVLLTGMGEDGAQGLLALRQAGGYTVAEDASTAVIHGMPGAAVALGGAVEELPLHKIAARLTELVSPNAGS